MRGLSPDSIGEIAFRHSIMLHELAPQAASLEEAFLESTEGEVEFGETARCRHQMTREGQHDHDHIDSIRSTLGECRPGTTGSEASSRRSGPSSPASVPPSGRW